MFELIKDIHRRRVIRDLLAAPRDKKIDNIEEVKSIGLICHLSDEQHWNILHHFTKVMESHGKSVHIIALQPKGQELNFVITHQATYKCREGVDFNFWGLPNNDIIRPFVERHYDLLVDTIGQENFFSQYIALRTPASLKVVYATPSEDPTEVYDLIIRGDGQVELKGFFNNVIEYLSMIKK